MGKRCGVREGTGPHRVLEAAFWILSHVVNVINRSHFSFVFLPNFSWAPKDSHLYKFF